MISPKFGAGIMTRLISIVFLFWLSFSAHAQSPADWWYFGAEAGVHFTGTGPVAVTDGVMTTQEGCASISSSQGELQFYTDGTYVWDSTHTIMPNGDSLLGNLSSTQSAVIVPYPGASHKYCIFTVRGCTGGSTTGPLGYYFAYSVVDMTLNGGLGDVLAAEKNIILFDSSAEKCTAMLHANGSDIWVLGHEQFTDKFHAYRLTSNGIVDTVTSQTGSIHSSCVSYMLANHSGNQVAVANFGTGVGVEVFDFDQQTGIVSNPDTIHTTNAYGVHFSPNDSVLYAGYTGGIYQYDLSAANPQATQYLVSDVSTYALAEGPDEKIYGTRYTTSYLSVINDPNELGAACLFQDSAVYLEGKICRIGLPNNVASGIFAISQIQISSFCFGDSTYFSVDTTNVDSLFWNFDDPASGSENTSTLINPSHLYTDSGTYTVMVIAHLDTIIDTAYQTIFIYPRQTLDLGSDTMMCFGDTLALDISQPFSNYLWSDGTTSGTYDVWTDSSVSVTLFGYCDTLMDTINVSFDTAVNFELGPDTTFCDGNSLILDANINVTADIFWNTGDSIDSITVTQTGYYELNAINACGPFRDTINIEVIPVVTIDLLPADTINCFDNEIVLVRPDNDSITFVWSDSTDSKTYRVDTTELVWLAAFNECGFWVDTMNIIFNGEIQTELGEDTTICDEDSVLLTTNDSLASFIWNTGDSTDTLWSEPGLDYNYIVTVTLRDCELIEQRRIIPEPDSCPPIDCELQISNVFTPDGDGINDKFRLKSDCEIYSYNLYIYNRWGQLVFSSVNDSFGWDGFINGEQASQGVYYYVVQYEDPDDLEAGMKLFKGHFTLKR